MKYLPPILYIIKWEKATRYKYLSGSFHNYIVIGGDSLWNTGITPPEPHPNNLWNLQNPMLSPRHHSLTNLQNHVQFYGRLPLFSGFYKQWIKLNLCDIYAACAVLEFCRFNFSYCYTSTGGSWNQPCRPRTDKAPTCPKKLYEAVLFHDKEGKVWTRYSTFMKTWGC